MNEELTNDWIEGALSTSRQVTIMTAETVERLATALLEERARPKLWDGAPYNARRGIVNWFDKNGVIIDSKTYTRELPKPRARQIAEEIVDELDSLPRHNTDIEVIESILTKYAEELTNTKET